MLSAFAGKTSGLGKPPGTIARFLMVAALLFVEIVAEAGASPVKTFMKPGDVRSTFFPDSDALQPFSFVFNGQSSPAFIADWHKTSHVDHLDEDRQRIVTSWTHPDKGLRVTLKGTVFLREQVLDWTMFFENTGPADTPIIENILPLDLILAEPMSGKPAYRLHRTKGAPSDPSDFEPSVVALVSGHTETMGAGGGRSSNRDFPFFKIETASGSIIIAVGWSGQWKADVSQLDDQQLRISAGMELTHFSLHPGEAVRSPRILFSYWPGNTSESNVRFRQCIYHYYAAPREGKTPLPLPYCNTCFTRGGGWLNECNAENQISLIRAYAPLGLEALLTDAGWFEGGWPAGAGNWTPRKDAYPAGMAPVADAAKRSGMIYGLWFEPERVVDGTSVAKTHPEWLLHSQDKSQSTYLLNFGLPDVQNFFFEIVKGFMDLPGFRVYRQDFNMDPLPYWRYTDSPDRQGITEIRYIQGLYAYWDRIAATWPDSLRIECSSGGRRIDLETICRMHVHQKSDFWFHNEVDQASIWGLSQYLPNNVFMAPINRMDNYSFHSTMATSLCLGWIADAPDFDRARGQWLLDRYRAVRHLLVGAWYPLLPYSRAETAWMASQYHRPDLEEGMILVYRHGQSRDTAAALALRGLDRDTTYQLSYDVAGTSRTARGNELMTRLVVELPDAPSSELIVYHRIHE